MADKIIITKDITTVPASSLVNGKVLGVNQLNKLSHTTYTEPIPLSQKGAVNGVATLDANGNVVQKSNLNIEVQPIGLNSPAPSKDGVFMPFEVGVYQNYGNLELTQNEKNSNIVYFYRLNGQFSKVVKSVDISVKANVDGGNITNIPQWQNKLQIGLPSVLNTTYKTDLVGAINEVNENNISKSSGTLQGVGWYRIARNNNSDGRYGDSFIVILERSYDSDNNESYIFSVNLNHGKSSITQISGIYNTRIIEKIRVSVAGSGANAGVDIYYNSSQSNYVNVSVIGSGSTTDISIAPPPNVYISELATSQGINTTELVSTKNYGNSQQWSQAYNNIANVNNEFNNVYDQISARANNRLSNLASDLSESEKQAIRQKLGL